MLYARQIPPEYQESPLFFGESFWPEEIVCCGNRGYKVHQTDAYEKLMKYAEDCADEIENLGHSWSYKNATEVIMDLLPPEHKKSYSTKEIKRWKELIEGYRSCRSSEEDDYIVQMLSLITGIKYSHTEIRGRCQGDWQHLYYPTEYGREFVKAFEIEYFNLGSEWIIHDEESEPSGPEDIAGYGQYILASGYSEDEVKAELADITGVAAEDIVLYRFSGWVRSAQYEVA